jgi:hypothetical protein
MIMSRDFRQNLGKFRKPDFLKQQKKMRENDSLLKTIQTGSQHKTKLKMSYQAN